jgi:pimeloyl-ACP methyl ester carboxylesterase
MSNIWIYLLVLLVGLLIVGSVGIAARYRREIKTARQRLKSLGSQVIETACGPIEYALVGEGYPVLVVHGAMGGFDQGLWLAQGFNITQHQVIAVSRFGYLRSPVPADANLDLQADAFASLLDALGIRRAAVFAVSAGATSAIRFTARHPQRVSALVLVCPEAPGEVPMVLPPRFVFDTLLRSDFLFWAMVTYFWKYVASVIGMAPKGTIQTPEQEAQAKKIQLGDLPVSQRMDGMVFECYAITPEIEASVTADSPYPLSQIDTPVLVIHAADDTISVPENVRGLAEQMPRARRYEVPDGGHFLYGHGKEVNAEIAAFLRSNVAELAGDTHV